MKQDKEVFTWVHRWWNRGAHGPRNPHFYFWGSWPRMFNFNFA